MDEPLKTFYRQVQDYDWVEVADRLLAPEALFHRLRGRAAVRMIRRYGQEPFVDIGCGIGFQSFAFAKICKKVYAIEMDEEKIKLAKKNAQILG